MKRVILLQRRYTKGQHTLTVKGDVTNETLVFVVKADRAVAGTRIIQKTYSAVNNDYFTAAYASASDLSTLVITILPAETASLASQYYEFDLHMIDPGDSDSRSVLVDGAFVLDLSVQSPYDSSAVDDGEYVNQAYDKILIYNFDSIGTGAKEIDRGFNATLTPSNESTGIYKLISNIDIFDENIFPAIAAVNVSDSSKMYLFAWYFQDAKTLYIKVFDFFAGAADCDFRLEIKRVRQ